MYSANGKNKQLIKGIGNIKMVIKSVLLLSINISHKYEKENSVGRYNN